MIGKDAVGRAFLDQLNVELQGIMDRTWNADQLLLYLIVILVRDPTVRTGSAIRKRIKHRLQSWQAGKIDMLVEDTEADLRKLLKSTRGGEATTQQRNKRFHQLLIHKGVTAAMAYIANREKGAMLLPEPARYISTAPIWSDGLGLGLWTTMSDPLFSGLPPSAVRRAEA